MNDLKTVMNPDLCEMQRAVVDSVLTRVGTGTSIIQAGYYNYDGNIKTMIILHTVIIGKEVAMNYFNAPF
jgi:hypothetical protein